LRGCGDIWRRSERRGVKEEEGEEETKLIKNRRQEDTVLVEEIIKPILW
jgi:hypothetical protein